MSVYSKEEQKENPQAVLDAIQTFEHELNHTKFMKDDTQSINGSIDDIQDDDRLVKYLKIYQCILKENFIFDSEGDYVKETFKKPVSKNLLLFFEKDVFILNLEN